MTLRINSLGKVRCRPDWIWNVLGSGFKDYDLWHVMEGRGRMALNGAKPVPVQGGDCWLFRPGMSIQADNDAKAPLTVIFTHFDIIAPESGSLPKTCQKLADPLFYSGLLHRMLACHRRGCVEEAERWLEMAIIELESEAPSVADEPERLEVRVKTLREAIEEHPERNYRLSRLSAKAGCCPAHFSRVFKAATGESFRDCVARARVERATQLLESTSYPMSKIAEICGFPDIYQFSKRFKARVGVPPSRLRPGTETAASRNPFRQI